MNTEQKIRILVVDDHPLMLAGIAGEISLQSDMQIVGEAANGAGAITAFREHRPDVTLMDIRMPGISGIEAITQIRAEFPDARFVVLTSFAGDVQVLRALQAGASGYLLKNLLRTELIDTIRVVHAGEKKISPEVAQQLATHVFEDHVTERELNVLRAVAKGRGNKTIADELCLSENTVKNHLKSIMGKLNASDRTEAVMIAIRRGYLEM